MYISRLQHIDRFRLVAAVSICLVLLLATPEAKAELGGNYKSILHDQAEMNATLTAQENLAYTTYILDMPDGTQVREYFSPNSGVFAIDWRGNGRRPNMRQVLGAYFDRFDRSAGALHTGLNDPLHRVDPDFVLDSRVIMRRFTGRAYIPQAVPQKVDIVDVR